MMGWDAFAHNTKGRLREFKAAAHRVKDMAGCADGLLAKGGLDCSNCATALEEATGENCWDDEGWSAGKVRRLATTAEWSEDIPEEEKWAVLSAREFLETCAKIGTGIDFSF